MLTVQPAVADVVVGGYQYKDEVWAAYPLPEQPKVPGHPADSPGLEEPTPPPGARVLARHEVEPPKWPAGATAIVDLGKAPQVRGRAAAAAGGTVKAASTPVSLSPAAPSALGGRARALLGRAPVGAAGTVRVRLADRGQAKRAGVDGVLVGLSRADRRTDAGGVSVSLDYSAIAQAYGGGWTSRLRLVAMPACALTTPQVTACRTRTPLESVNDSRSHKVTGTLAVPAGTAAQPTGGTTAKATGNVQRYDWATESNYYNMGYGQVAENDKGGKITKYVRGGRLTQISYGYQLADARAGREPAAKVVFRAAQRCTTSDTVCKADNLSSKTAKDWPDTPYDLHCESDWKNKVDNDDTDGVCLTSGPTFWSTYRLKGVDASVRTSSGWQDVDSYELQQVFSDAGGTYDPVTGNTQDPKRTGSLQSVMWLSSIVHTGKDTSAGGDKNIVNVASKRSLGEQRALVGQPSLSCSRSKTALNAVTVHFARELAEPAPAPVARFVPAPTDR
ncbi:hypothetical protein ACWGJB_00765 [Streptomyces sp. NPDC054813]